MSNLAAFEQDRIARLNEHYAQKRAQANDPDAWLNGSVGNPCVYLPARTSGAVNVSRGAW